MRKCLFSFALLLVSVWAIARENPRGQEWLQQSNVSFTENKGQVVDTEGNARPDIQYTAEMNGVKLYFQKNAISYVFPKVVDNGKGQQVLSQLYRLDLQLLGANPSTQVISEEANADVANYYLAHVPNGVTGVRSFRKITYKNIYSNIDLVFYGARGGAAIKYDFIVHPGGKVSDIQLKYVAADDVQLLADGSLKIVNPLGNLVDNTPYSYVLNNGKTGAAVGTQYSINKGIVSFEVEGYDQNQTLVIDPLTRSWSTYYGDNSLDRAYGVAIAGNGNVAVTGYTQNSGFPVTPGFAHQSAFGGVNDAFVISFDGNGNRRWATFYGGSSIDQASGVAVDGSNNIFITGYSSSSNFSTTDNKPQAGGGDAFIVKFNNDGVRQFATLFGGNSNDQGNAIAIDSQGNPVVAGFTFSANLGVSGGVSGNPFQSAFAGVRDGFVAKFTNNGGLTWATYLGGANDDQALGVDVDNNNNVIVAGLTSSNNFPATNGSLAGGNDVFVASFTSNGARNWATYWGGTGNEQANAVTVDAANSIIITGQTNSTAGIAATTGPSQLFQANFQGGSKDGFIAKLSNAGSPQWATYYGGSADDEGLSIAADASNNIYLTGITNSTNFPTQGGFQSSSAGNNEAFIIQLAGNGSPSYASYYGGSQNEVGRGIAVRGNSVAMVGQTSSLNFPIQNAFQQFRGGNDDAFVTFWNGDGGSGCNLAIDGVPANSACGATCSGSIQVSVSGGNGAPTYSWAGPNNFNSSQQNVTGLCQGVYTLTVNAGVGCTDSRTFTILQSGSLNVNITTNGNVLRTSGSFGGVAPYRYAWAGPASFSATTDTVIATVAGAYTLTVTDANGCQGTDVELYNPNTGCPIFNGVKTDIACFGLTDGKVEVVTELLPIGARAEYSLDNGNWVPNNFFLGLGKGNHNVRARVVGKPECDYSYNFEIIEPALLQITSVIPSDITCNGANNGSLTVNVTGGTPDENGNYRYSVNNGPKQSNNVIGNLSPGVSYRVRVEDVNNCPAISSRDYVLAEPAPLAATVQSQTNVACFGSNSGSISVIGQGGVPPYAYALTPQGGSTLPNQASGVFTGLPGGNHTITVRDANNCTFQVPFRISAPAPLSVSIVFTRDATCFNAADGSVTVSVNGGTAPYRYSINGGPLQSAVTFAGLARGEYRVTVVDANGCEATSPLGAIYASPQIQIQSVDIEGVDCFNGNSGAISINVGGGIPPYEYLWSNGATASAVSGLSAGTHSVTITDALGCELNETFNVPSNSGIMVSANVSDVRCNGGNSGAIDVSVAGGQAPYTYAWSNGSRAQDVAGLMAGEYNVTVTDRLGCSVTYEFEVEQPAFLMVSEPMVTDVSCNGGSDGGAGVMVSGGVEPYSYAWSNGSNDYMIANVAAGRYTVTVNDANGCIASVVTANVGQPAPLAAEIASSGNLTCYDAGDGVISVMNVRGGTAPYFYSLDGENFGNVSGMFEGLSAGTYTVTIQDNNGCTLNLTRTLTQPNQILGTVQFKANIACYGLTDGKIAVSAAGGTGSASGFLYSLDNPAGPYSTVSTFDGLTKGDHIVYIQDLGNNCITGLRETIVEPAELRFTSEPSVTNISCQGFPTATITAYAEGGTTTNASGDYIPYSYKLGGGVFGSTNVFNSLAPGNYDVIVRDHNLCTDTARVTVLSGLNARVTVTPASCFGGNDASVNVMGLGGRAPYSYSIDGGPFQNNGVFSGLSARDYQIRAMDSQGCMFSQTVSVGSRASVAPAISASHTARCEGFLVTLNASTNLGAGASVNYQWLNNGAAIAGATGSTYVTGVSGAYTVRVTNLATGCSETSPAQNITIWPDPRTVITTAVPGAPIEFCKGNKVELLANTAQVPGPIFNWYKDGVFVQGGIDRVYTAFETGNYTCVVVTANGCTNESAPFQVIVHQIPEAHIYTPAKNVICPNETIRLQGSRDTQWSYVWNLNGNPIANTNDYNFNATQAGRYTITITNQVTGCRATSPATELIANPLAFTTASNQPSGCGAADGQIMITATGNVGMPAYSVNGSGYVDFSGMTTVSGLTSGAYAINVRDAQCTVSQSVDLDVASPVVTSILGINYNYMDIAWSNIPDARYNIQYRVVGSETWSSIENLANNISAFDGAPVPSVRIQNLQHQTRYEIRIQATCSGDFESTWSPVERVTTPRQITGRCFMPANIYVNLDANDEQGAWAYWTVPVGGELNPVCYDLQYRVKGTSNWFSLRVDDTQIPYRLRNLLTSTTYELRMRTNCVTCPGSEEARLSWYSPIIEFTTTNLCPEAGDLTLNGGTATETVCGMLELKVDNLTHQDNMTYQWIYSNDGGLNFNNADGDANNTTYMAMETGYYAAIVTIGNCEPVTTAPIDLRVNQIPGVNSEIVAHVTCYQSANGALRAGCTGDNNVCLDRNGNPDYQFSVNGINWQDDGLFENLTAGNYTVYVRKKSTGCSSTFTHPVYTTISEPGLPEFDLEWPGAGNIDITWTQVPGAAGYRIAYRILGTGDNAWSYLPVDLPYNPNTSTNITRTITDLQRNGTIYEVRIQTRCAFDNSLGVWTESQTVVVDPQDPFLGCVTPGGVFISNVSLTSARINWQPTSQAISYIVEYREFGDPSFTRINNVMGTSYTITGLMPGSQYYVRVIARCSNVQNDISSTSVTLLFAASLPKAGIASEGENFNTISVYPNPNKGNFNIDFTVVEAGTADIQLIDVNGRVVYNTTIDTQIGDNSFPVELTNTLPGMYVLQVKQGNSQKTVKVSIN